MQKEINTNSLHYKMQDCFDIVWNTGDEIERDWSVQIATSMFMEYCEELEYDSMTDSAHLYSELTGIFSTDTPWSFTRYYCYQFLENYKKIVDGNEPINSTLH